MDMCNNYERQIEWEQYSRAMGAAELGTTANAGPEQLPASENVWVSNVAPVMVASGNAVDLVLMHWSLLPSRPGGAPVFNFRSEGRRFGDSNRCLVPASAFFEFTGSRSPKSKWRFALEDSPVLAMAGLWREQEGEHRFTILTTAPGPDVKPFHNRQVVVLRPEQWGSWLYLDRPEDDILQPLPAGSLRLSLVRRGAESPPSRLLDAAGQVPT